MGQEQSQPMQTGKINKALGLFLLCFAAVIFVAVFFTDTFVGKMTNLIAGLILAGIGAIMVLKSGPKSSAS